jgi:hypothetical protein
VYNTSMKRNKRKPKQCRNCGQIFLVKPSRFDREKCCSKECSLKWKKEHGMSEESKQKISQTKGGIKKEKRICVGCGIEFEVERWKKKRYHNRECSGRATGKLSTIPWNKGLTKDDPRVKASLKKHSETLRKRYITGEIEAWNKGLNKVSDERIAKGAQTQSDTWWNKPEEERNKIKKTLSKSQVQAHASGKYPHCFTQPEKITWEYLESLGYSVKEFKEFDCNDPPNTWYHQFNFMNTFVPDFGCPDLKSVIEVNGCYVHGHYPDKCSIINAISKFAQTNIKRDKQKYSFYHRNGWRWALVWECEARQKDFHRIHRELNL